MVNPAFGQEYDGNGHISGGGSDPTWDLLLKLVTLLLERRQSQGHSGLSAQYPQPTAGQSQGFNPNPQAQMPPPGGPMAYMGNHTNDRRGDSTFQGQGGILPYLQNNPNGWGNQPPTGAERGGMMPASQIGGAIADSAARVAASMNTSGYCYRGVKAALRPFGIHLTGGSAYMATAQLMRNGMFRRVNMDPSQAPPGSVIVSDPSPGRPHGHIAVVGRDGSDLSDTRRASIIRRPSQHVFVPVGGSRYA